MRTYHAHVYVQPEKIEEWKALHKSISFDKIFEHVKVGKLHENPIGPHEIGQFQLAFDEIDFCDLISYLMVHRKGLNVLVHPETGNDLLDHTEHCFWLGERLPLDTSRL